MPVSPKVHDVVIIGGGPAGSCTAMFLKKYFGIQSLIIEKERFPRYHIGESFTGETGGQLRKLDMGHVLDSQEYLTKLGTKVYGKGGNNSFYIPVMARVNGELQDATDMASPAQRLRSTSSGYRHRSRRRDFFRRSRLYPSRTAIKSSESAPDPRKGLRRTYTPK